MKTQVCDLGKEGLENSRLALVQIGRVEGFLNESLRCNEKKELDQFAKILSFVHKAIVDEANIIVLPEYTTKISTFYLFRFIQVRLYNIIGVRSVLIVPRNLDCGK